MLTREQLHESVHPVMSFKGFKRQPFIVDDALNVEWIVRLYIWLVLGFQGHLGEFDSCIFVNYPSYQCILYV